MKTTTFETTKEFVLWLHEQSTINHEFKTRTYKFEEHTVAALDDRFHTFKTTYRLTTTRGTGFYARTAEIELPEATAEILKVHFPKVGYEYKGRKTLGAIFNILKKDVFQAINWIVQVETDAKINQRNLVIERRVNDINNLLAALLDNATAGYLQVNEDQIQGLKDLAGEIGSQKR